jgi:outer membrane murein-binding lipoprotein Lpp
MICAKCRNIVIAVLVILFLGISAIPNTARSYSDYNVPSAIFYTYRKPQLLIVLRDLVSALRDSEDLVMYLRGGIPQTISFTDTKYGESINIFTSISINNATLDSMSFDSYAIEFKGFYVKTSYSSKGMDLTLYAAPIYGSKAFYISLCISGSASLSHVMLLLRAVEVVKVIDVKSSSLTLLVKDVPVNLLLSPGIRFIHIFNETSIGVEVALPSEGCLSALLSFNPSTNIDWRSVAEGINKTFQEFAEIISKYPVIRSTDLEIQNLYLLSLYNTINMLTPVATNKSYVDSLSPEMLALNYISLLLNPSITCASPPNKILTIDDAYAVTVTAYLYLARGRCTDYITRDFVESILSYLANVSTFNSLPDLAKAYKIADLVELIATSNGYQDLVKQVRTIEEELRSKLQRFYNGFWYSTSPGTTMVEDKDLVMLAAIANYGIPYAEEHLKFVARFISKADPSKISIDGKYISDAIEALARYGYLDQALKLTSIYYKAVVNDGIPCLDFFKAVLKGFLGIDATFGGIVIKPCIPLVLANTTLIISSRTVSFYEWGTEIEKIYIDGALHLSPIISWDTWFGSKSIAVFLKGEKLFRLCLQLLERGAPIAGSAITILTASSLTSIGYTNSSGALCTILPCSSKQVQLVVGSRSISITLDTATCTDTSMIIDVAGKETGMEKTSQQTLSNISNISKDVENLHTIVNQLSTAIRDLQRDVNAVKSNASNALAQVSILREEVSAQNAFTRNLLYILLAISVTALALSIYSSWGRK